MSIKMKNPGGASAGASEDVKLELLDASETISVIPLTQVSRTIARRYRVSLFHARLIVENLRGYA